MYNRPSDCHQTSMFGDLDPYYYISNSQLNKATRVMNAGNYERLGDALGEFLDYEEKAAFYYLKNNGLL